MFASIVLFWLVLNSRSSNSYLTLSTKSYPTRGTPTFEVQDSFVEKSTDFKGFHQIKSAHEEVESSLLLEREDRVPRFMLDLFDRHSGNSGRSPLSADTIRVIHPWDYGYIMSFCINFSLNFEDINCYIQPQNSSPHTDGKCLIHEPFEFFLLISPVWKRTSMFREQN